MRTNNTENTTDTPMQFKCKACDHIWTPRNQETTKNRKCSRCGSTEVVMLPRTHAAEQTEKRPTQPDTDTQKPAALKNTEGEIDVDELLEYINKKPEPKKPAAQDSGEDAEAHTPEKTGFKIHPVLLAAILIVGIGIAAVFFLRRNRIRQNQRIMQQTNKQEEKQPQKITRPVIGFYANGSA